ncbi:MAG: TetR/AcrR family transcriptional regulator [Bacteroides sp.]|nr:TetR/AcrR family transcriptional regulator [Bacteroides sp.]MCM1448665.1 TetR/AcrR family transcriptional regulator [Bacteroides sp.]
MEEPIKSRRPRRRKKDIEEGIVKAAAEVVIEKGFVQTNIKDIMQRADMEPQIFYRRYDSLQEFYKKFVKDNEFWLSDLVVAPDTDTESHEARLIKLLNGLVDNLKKDSVMLELLRWEIAEDNEITRASAQKREFSTLGLTKEYEFLFRNTGVDVVGIATLIISGIYYLSLHRDRSEFCEIDMREEQSIERVKGVIAHLVRQMFRQKGQMDIKKGIAERMRQDSLSEDAIRRYIND